MAKQVTLKDIHEEVRELRLLYKRLVDRQIRFVEPTAEEKRAIKERGEVAGEKELLETLGVHN